jgi:hypothetical protein
MQVKYIGGGRVTISTYPIVSVGYGDTVDSGEVGIAIVAALAERGDFDAVEDAESGDDAEE